MANERVPTPMLEAFLVQAEAPDVGVLSDRLDWPIAILAFCLISLNNGPDWLLFAGIGVAGGALFILRTARANKLKNVAASKRIEYERWRKVRRFKKLLKQHMLTKKAPAPVLVALEQAARAWHDSRESLSRLVDAEPDFATEMLHLVDCRMSSAIAAAEPVVIRDDQHRRHLEQIENDTDLMARVCLHIQEEEGQIRKLAGGAGAALGNPSGTLRERLEAARRERELAEAELDTLI